MPKRGEISKFFVYLLTAILVGILLVMAAGQLVLPEENITQKQCGAGSPNPDCTCPDGYRKEINREAFAPVPIYRCVKVECRSNEDCPQIYCITAPCPQASCINGKCATIPSVPESSNCSNLSLGECASHEDCQIVKGRKQKERCSIKTFCGGGSINPDCICPEGYRKEINPRAYAPQRVYRCVSGLSGCGNNVCEEGEAAHQCLPCEKEPCPAAPCVLQKGTCPQDCEKICAAVCVEMWKLSDNTCTFVECGSGCGPNGFSTFKTWGECKANRVSCFNLSLSECESYDYCQVVKRRKSRLERCSQRDY